MWNVNHLRLFLFGRKLLLITDHRLLMWLLTIIDPKRKLASNQDFIFTSNKESNGRYQEITNQHKIYQVKICHKNLST